MGAYITVAQAATLLHESPTTVRRWIYQGRSIHMTESGRGEHRHEH
jgi:Helix-turn-helix domain